MAESVLWMLAEWSLRTTLLAAAAGLFLWCFRVKDVTRRLAVWTVVLAGALLLPLASLGPELAIPAPMPDAWLLVQLGSPAPASVTIPPPDNAGLSAGPLDTFLASELGLQAPQPSHRWFTRGPVAVFGLWLTVSAAMLARLVFGLLLVRRLVKASRPVEAGVYESREVAVPVTVGVMRPVILLPPDWRSWEQRKLQAVLAHERAHLMRRDTLRSFAASLYRGLCWFHPLAWWLHARLADLVEASSDDAALAVMNNREFYAEVLLEFLEHAPRRVRWEGTAMVRDSRATKRVDRVLDSRQALSVPLTRVLRAVLILLAAPLIYLDGSTRLAGTAPQDGVPESLFARSPMTFQNECREWTNGRPDPAPPGSYFSSGDQPLFVRIHSEDMTLSRADVPALTVTADSGNYIGVAGSRRSDWTMRFCAQGSGQIEAEAKNQLQTLSMTRIGSSVSLNSSPAGEGSYTWSNLIVDAPADAPIVLHGSRIDVRDMAGPVRITASAARAKILDTTGQVDADAGVVDFAGSRGRVSLSAVMEINLKMTAPQFEGTLRTWAQGDVRILVPPGFSTPIDISAEKKVVCRADFCSKMTQRKDGVYKSFNYAGTGSNPSGSFVRLWSEHGSVVIDTVGRK